MSRQSGFYSAYSFGPDFAFFASAPYLVTFQQWIKYLETFGGDHQLEGFGLMQSAR